MNPKILEDSLVCYLFTFEEEEEEEDEEEEEEDQAIYEYSSNKNNKQTFTTKSIIQHHQRRIQLVQYMRRHRSYTQKRRFDTIRNVGLNDGHCTNRLS